MMRRILISATALLALCPALHAAENVILRNGSEFLCTHQEPTGDHIRLYLYPTSTTQTDAGYIDIVAVAVARIETVPDPVLPPAPTHNLGAPRLETETEGKSSAPLTPAETRQLLTRAGQTHNIDADLLASVVHAESGGNPRAVSRAGARGLMQLMPATAANLGVSNSFAPEQNVNGGTAYLDQLLTRYHDNIALALAAYNAGPQAVDRYHGIPPYAETRAYVARIIREFNAREYNRRKLATRAIQTASLR